MKKSTELIQRYFLGIASEEDVRELESGLKVDADLQEEYLFHAETDSHLRQESQRFLNTERAEESKQKADESIVVTPSRSSNVWKWMSGISTVLAITLLILLVSNFPPPREAMASLGELAVSVSWSEQNIWSATGRGDLFGIRRELKRNVPVDARSDDELTPLHVSAIFNQKEATEILIAGGAKLFLVDAKGNTALHMAAFLGHTDIVRLLLSAGAKPNVRNNLGFSAADLVSVAWNARLEDYYHKVERTLNLTLDLNRIRSERPGILNLLSMPRPGASKTPPSISIWQAAITGNILAVKQHIVAGTDVNSEEDLTGNTPLTLSAIFGHSEVAKLLVEAGADIEHLNKSGDTAIHLACFFCQPDIVKLLVRFGADPNKRNKYNATCIDRVSSELNMEMEAVYRHVYDSLNLQLDFQNIRAARHQIAIFLKEHIAENRVLPKEIPAK